MIQEDKELLLIDLSARLPYHPIVYVDENLPRLKLGVATRVWEYVAVDKPCKPYLRPMSSMTEEEKLHVELRYGFFYHDGVLDNVHIFETMGTYDRDGNYDPPSKYREQRRVTIEQVLDFIHWLNVHHFDYRGLIEKGLALEALEGMYNIKEYNYGNN